MDEPTFQCELSQLKQQVGKMLRAFEHQPSPTATHRPSHAATPPTSPNTFTTQLNELKARLSELQASTDQQAKNLTQPPSQHWNQYLPSSDAPPQHHPSSPKPPTAIGTANTSLLPGPLLWQLITILRSDLRGVNSRLVAVEQSVSELDDRVEQLEPGRVTPASSFSSQVEGYNASEQNGEHSIEHDDHEAGSWGEPQVGPGEQVVDDQSLFHYTHYASENVLPPFNAPRDVGNMTSPAHGLHDVEKALDDMEKNLGEARKGLDEAKRSLFEQLPPASLQDSAIKNTHSSRRKRVPCANDIIQTNASDEGVLFRDKEILRLEELLRDAHEKLSAQEDTITARDTDAAKTQDAYEESLEAQQSACHKLRSALHRERSNNAVVLQANRRLKDERTALECRVQDLEQALYKSRETSRAQEDDVDSMLATRDEEIRRLGEFCERKDAVASRQEEIIARGADLLEQRDDHISRLEDRLRCHEEDATRDAQEADRLLHDGMSRERSLLAKIAEFKSELKQREHAYSKAEEEERNKQPWTLAVERARSDDLSKRPYRWSLSPGVSFGKKTPYEQARASVWEVGSHQEDGRAAAQQHSRREKPDSPPSPKPRRGSGSKGKNKQGDRGDNRAQLEHHASPLQRTKHSHPADQPSDRSPARKREPLRHRHAFDPPPPAPTHSLGHSQSMNTMRFSRASGLDPQGGEHGKALSRHHSLQELPRGRLQPYVETEPESEGWGDRGSGGARCRLGFGGLDC